MLDVSIIIVNYNTKELTKQCIDNIFEKTTDISFEVIVIDNNSSDSSVEMFSSDTRIRFIESGKNLGFGKANNIGIKYSKGKYLFFLNSDTILLNNAIKMMFDFMESHNTLNIGALGTILLDGKHERTHSYGNLPTICTVLKQEWGDHILKRFGKRMYRHDENVKEPNYGYFKVGYVTGADLFCSKEVIKKAGAFDSDFFMYWEETEMQHRWGRIIGTSNYVLRGPKIIHLEGQSGQPATVMSSIKKMPSMFMYFKKTVSPWAYYAFRFFMLIGRIPQLLLSGLSKEEKKMLLKSLTQKY